MGSVPCEDAEAALGLAWLSRWGCSPLLRALKNNGLRKVWTASRPALLEWGLTPVAAERFHERRRAFSLQRMLQALENESLFFVPYGAAEYPTELHHLEYPPAGLFCRGAAARLADLGSLLRIAIVGTRKATPYGKGVAARFAAAFAEAGVAVVSGLAFGIDGRAHESALDAGGLTVAILGCGVDIVYPPRHRRLYQRVAERGLILSELPPGCPPARWTFPHRNRLLAALGDAVLIAEGSVRSGAMQTVEWALGLGRGVFSIPGPVLVDNHTGCNTIIAEGAFPALEPRQTVEEFLRQTGMVERSPRHRPLRTTPCDGVDGGRVDHCADLDGATRERIRRLGLDGVVDTLVRALERGPCSADDLIAKNACAPREVTAALGLLELAGAVHRVGPGLFIRAP